MPLSRPRRRSADPRARVGRRQRTPVRSAGRLRCRAAAGGPRRRSPRPLRSAAARAAARSRPRPTTVSTRPPRTRHVPASSRVVPAWKTNPSSTSSDRPPIRSPDRGAHPGSRRPRGRSRRPHPMTPAAGGPRIPARSAASARQPCAAARRSGPSAVVQPGKDHLRLRVAEPCVAFEQRRALGGQDQAGVEGTAERGAPAGELGEQRQVERRHDPCHGVIRQVRQRAVGAHPAGVRAGIAVTQPLVVAGSRQGEGRDPVGEGDDARLRTAQPLLDHDPGSAVDGGRRPEDLLDRGEGLAEPVADRDALAGGEAIGLDHDAVAARIELGGECPRWAFRRECRAARHPHAGRLGNLVAERLGSLDPRGGGRRTERREPGRRQCVRDAGRERRLRSDHHQVRGRGAGCRHDAHRVEWVARHDGDAPARPPSRRCRAAPRSRMTPGSPASRTASACSRPPPPTSRMRPGIATARSIRPCRPPAAARRGPRSGSAPARPRPA